MQNIYNKGMSLIALITTIIIGIMIISTVVISYNNIKDDTDKKEFAKEIYSLNKLMYDYNLLNGSYPIGADINFDLTNLTDQNQFAMETADVDNIILLKKIDLTKLGVEDIARGNKEYSPIENDVYAFSLATKKIYYLKGVKIGKTTYYTLTEELLKLIQINEVK